VKKIDKGVISGSDKLVDKDLDIRHSLFVNRERRISHDSKTSRCFYPTEVGGHRV